MYEVSVTRRNVMDPECQLPLSKEIPVYRGRGGGSQDAKGSPIIRLTVSFHFKCEPDVRLCATGFASGICRTTVQSKFSHPQVRKQQLHKAE